MSDARRGAWGDGTGPRSLGRGRLLPALAAAALLAFSGGFAGFVISAYRPGDAPAHADGIVVLTGGAERVETGLRLLAEHRAGRLLVSGVAHGTDLAELARVAGVDAAPLADRVTLGRRAGTTRGNAAETAAWVAGADIHTLIVVTGFYHMPRALAELSRDLPGVVLYRAPVTPVALRRPNAATLRLLSGEYLKYLAVEAGLSRDLPPLVPWRGGPAAAPPSRSAA